MKSEIRNPKLETISKVKIRNGDVAAGWRGFGFRISDFGILPGWFLLLGLVLGGGEGACAGATVPASQLLPTALVDSSGVFLHQVMAENSNTTATVVRVAASPADLVNGIYYVFQRARSLGLPAVVAIADTRGTALIAARRLAWGAPPASEARSEAKPSEVQCASKARSEAKSSEPSGAQCASVQVIPPGGDAAFLAPLALDLLNPDDALADALSRFGLRRVGDLLRTPERALLNRLGPALLPLLALARGEDSAPPPRAPDAVQFEEGADLEAPVALLEPLLFVLRGLLARLAARLDCRGLAFGALTLDFALEGGGRDVRTLGLAAPTLDVRSVLRLAALALEATPLGAAIDAVSVTTEGAALRGDQLDFFAPAGPAPAALSRTLAELAALCGPERVGAPALADAHRPDAFALAPFSLAALGAASLRAPRGAGGGAHSAGSLGSRAESPTSSQSSVLALGLAVRALRPPLAASVRSARGAPYSVQSALANGEVVRCAGPWRTTGQWWSDARYAFDHYDVQTSDGNVVRLRRDLLHERWEIDGVFD